MIPFPLHGRHTLLALCVATLWATTALAAREDRQAPVDIEADRVSIDDRNKVHVFEGHVKLTQGSLMIQSDKLVVIQNASGFQAGTATGGRNGLASFRQRREGSEQYVEGEAERIEYDAASERTRLYNRARVSSGGDVVQGQFIEYDAISERYRVLGTPSQDGRVRATIQPKSER